MECKYLGEKQGRTGNTKGNQFIYHLEHPHRRRTKSLSPAIDCLIMPARYSSNQLAEFVRVINFRKIQMQPVFS